MGRRTIREAALLVGTLVLVWLCTAAAAWAYPLGRATIEAVGWVGAALAILFAVRPLMSAMSADRGADGE